MRATGSKPNTFVEITLKRGCWSPNMKHNETQLVRL